MVPNPNDTTSTRSPPTSRTTWMTPSVRCSVDRSWTTWTVNVPRCGTTTVSDRTRMGVPPMTVVWTSRPLVDAAWIPGSYGRPAGTGGSRGDRTGWPSGARIIAYVPDPPPP